MPLETVLEMLGVRMVPIFIKEFRSKSLKESKDLASSLQYLENGVNCLKSRRKYPLIKLAPVSLQQSYSKNTKTHPLIDDAFALIRSSDSQKISSELFDSARKDFDLAYQKATDAFNESNLFVENYILASQIISVARVLQRPQYWKNRGNDVTQWLTYLDRLHQQEDIRKTFSVLTKGGPKSWFNRTRRLNDALAVHLWNLALFEIAEKVMKEEISILEWSKISLGKKNYHPMFGYERLVKESTSLKVIPPSLFVRFDEKVELGCSVVNSKEEIVARVLGKKSLKIFNRLRETRKLCNISVNEDARDWELHAVDVDKEDNTYLITASKECNDEVWKFQLLVVDANGNKKLECSLPLRQKRSTRAVFMAISKQGKIAILDRINDKVHIGSASVEKNTYQFQSFCVEKSCPHFSSRSIRFSYFEGVKIVVLSCYTVYIYTEDGKLEQKFELPSDYGAGISLEINHVTKRILIETQNSLQFPSYNLLQFSDSGELLDNFCLGSNDQYEYSALTAHLNGSVVLSGKRGAAYLQLRKMAEHRDDEASKP